MANLKLLGDDAATKYMLEGFTKGFKAELKALLMQAAEQEVDAVVDRVAARLETKLQSSHDYLTDSRNIKLEVLFRKEDPS